MDSDEDLDSIAATIVLLQGIDSEKKKVGAWVS